MTARRARRPEVMQGLGPLPRCPGHLTAAAAREWRRVAAVLHAMGVLTLIDRAALAAYCQAYGRWVDAEQRLGETPMLVRTPSGYVQQSPWLGIANKQMELMGRYLVELGMTPAARSRVMALAPLAVTDRSLTGSELAALGDEELDAMIAAIEAKLEAPS
jgi:P27 family predicted phage terminase small subunit